MSSNKQELCSEATSNKINNKNLLLLQGQETIYPDGTENKIETHTDNDNKQLELGSKITRNNNPYRSPLGHLGNPAGEEQDQSSDSMSTSEDITIRHHSSFSMLRVPVSLQAVLIRLLWTLQQL